MRAVLFRSTVFRYNIYDLSAGGFSWGNKDLANIRVSYSASDMGASGITTAQLSADVYLTESERINFPQFAEPGSDVTISVPLSGFSFPPFKLGFYDINGHVLSLTAYDKTADSDVTFKAGDQYRQYVTIDGKPVYEDEEKTIRKLEKYSAANVYSNACAQIGMGASPPQGLDGMLLYYSEFVGKSIRSILTEFSKCVPGVIYSSGSGIAAAAKFMSENSAASVEDKDRSPINFCGGRSISHVYLTDEVYNKTYEYGDAPWYNTISVSGSYFFTEDIRGAAAGGLMATYYAWKCENAVVDMYLPVSSKFNGLIVLEAEFRLGACEVIASLGAPANQQSAADFENEEKRALATKADTEKRYGNMFIDKNSGLTFYYEKKKDE